MLRCNGGGFNRKVRTEGAKGAENNDELLVIPIRSEESLGSNYQLLNINEGRLFALCNEIRILMQSKLRALRL